MFYEPKSSQVAILQDQISRSAALMASSDIPCEERYYTDKQWRRKVNSIQLLAFERAEIGPRERKKLIDILKTQIPKPLPQSRREFGQSISTNIRTVMRRYGIASGPHSQNLRVLPPKKIGKIRPYFQAPFTSGSKANKQSYFITNNQSLEMRP
jgi:hypothetical protein